MMNNELHDIFQKYAAVVFVDVETTGLDPVNCRIIELAALRIEPRKRGGLRVVNNADLFVKLPESERLPKEITELTGITDTMLESKGMAEVKAAEAFTKLIYSDKGRVLIVAHNAQFDLSFITELMKRTYPAGVYQMDAADYLDSLTVYKDRRAYPHKLENAIATYRLENKVRNSHRAVDDVAALYEVCKAMDAERADLLNYVNIFGYNPKYGVKGHRLEGVTYWPQSSNQYKQSLNNTLPERVKRRTKQ